MSTAEPEKWSLVSSGDQYSQLALQLSSVDASADGYAHAAVVEVRAGGMLLVLPADALPEDLLAAALSEGLTGTIGPHRRADGVRLIGARGAPVVQTTSILLVDFSDELADSLTDAAIVDPKVVVPFATVRGQHRWPCSLDVRAQWVQWTQAHAGDFSAGRLSGFTTPPDLDAAPSSGRARLPVAEPKPPRVALPVPKAPPARGPNLLEGEAERSGVTPDQLQELLRLAGSVPSRLPPAGTRAAATPADLIEAVAAEADGADYGDRAGAEPALPLAMSSNDELMRTVLVALAQKLVGQSSIGGENFLAEESEQRPLGARGCAARSAFIDAIPKKATQHVEAFKKRLAVALDMDVSALQPGSLRAYFQMRSPLGSHKLLTYNAFLVARHWELLEGVRQKVMALPPPARATVLPSHDHAMFQVALHAIFLDQTAIDNGRYGMSWHLTSLPAPPFNLTRSHTDRFGEEPFTQLCDPTWVTVVLGYLRDLEVVAQRSQKYNEQQQQQQPPQQQHPQQPSHPGQHQQNQYRAKAKPKADPAKEA
eukprot:2821347-Amphidinium_carterae.2